MDLVQRTAQFVAGLRAVEQAIAAEVNVRGHHLRAESFLWNHGKDFVPAPEAISLEVHLAGKRWSAILSREQIEDAGGGDIRADVQAAIRDAVAKLCS